MAVTDLGSFILEEMRKRGNISARAFSQIVGVSSATINAQINKTGDPSLNFLRQLSKATGVNIQTLIALAFPDVAQDMQIDARALLLARELGQLSEAEFNLFERLIHSSK